MINGNEFPAPKIIDQTPLTNGMQAPTRPAGAFVGRWRHHGSHDAVVGIAAM